MFNKTFREQQKMIDVPEIRDTFGVSNCLQTAKDNGFDNDGCFVDFFLRGSQKGDFFEYSNLTDSNPGSAQVDACLVFSGPALHPDPTIAAPFTACLQSYANATSCSIPSIVWSGMNFSVYIFVSFAFNITGVCHREVSEQGRRRKSSYHENIRRTKTERICRGRNSQHPRDGADGAGADCE